MDCLQSVRSVVCNGRVHGLMSAGRAAQALFRRGAVLMNIRLKCASHGSASACCISLCGLKVVCTGQTSKTTPQVS